MESKNKKTSRYKRVLHPNRYFIYAIVLLLVSTGLLLSFIYISTLRFNTDSEFSSLKTKKIYTDKQSGYTVRYPNSWQIERDQSGNVVFENPDNEQESLTVTPASLEMEGVIRHSINIRSEKDLAKDDTKIALIKAGTANNDQDLDVAIIKNDQKLFYVSGHSSALEIFARNFKIQ